MNEFSKFIREATEEEKRVVYERVMDEVCDQQRMVMDENQRRSRQGLHVRSISSKIR